MQWGYMPVNGNIGDGDDDSGVDRKWNGGHYDGLFNTLLRKTLRRSAGPGQPHHAGAAC